MNKLDVVRYFENKGYKVTRLEGLPTEPEYMVEKNGVKKTVDIIEWSEESKSVSQFVYDRIISGGFFVITPYYFSSHGHRKIRVYTKDDIKRVAIAKTYIISWKD